MLLTKYSVGTFIALVLSISVQAAPKVNCTTSCTIASDPFPLTGSQPTSCKLYNGTTLVAQSAVVPGAQTTPGAPAGSVACAVVATFPQGSYTVTMSSADATQESAKSAPFQFDSVAALIISTGSLSNATVGTSYSANLSASGGTAPYSWAIVAGQLPAGMTLSGSVISGTPTVSGTFSFSVTVTDASGWTTTKALSITVTTPPLPVPQNLRVM